MKIRSGFVSNSSSSSYICIIKKDAFQKTMEKAHPYVRAVVEEMDPAERNLFGIECVVITTYLGQGGDRSWDYLEVDYDSDIPKDLPKDPWPGEVLQLFLSNIPKDMYFEEEGYN